MARAIMSVTFSAQVLLLGQLVNQGIWMTTGKENKRRKMTVERSQSLMRVREKGSLSKLYALKSFKEAGPRGFLDCLLVHVQLCINTLFLVLQCL